MPQKKIFLIDFDSTFTQVEALDELAAIVLKDNAERQAIEQEISSITREAMQGDLPFDIALKKRIQLLPAKQSHIQALVKILCNKVSVSFQQNEPWLRMHASSIYIISGGFLDFILPVVTRYGLHANHVFANQFIYNNEHEITGYDETNMLSQAGGKIMVTRSLNLKGHIIIIGDGYTDYEIKASGEANEFYLFTENIRREQLISKADKVIENLDQLIQAINE